MVRYVLSGRRIRLHVDGRQVEVRRILEITPTHIVVEHMDGTIEAIELSRLSSESKARLGVLA